MARCFWPRHAYRVRYKGTTADLLICFECSRIQLEFGDKEQLARLARQERWNRIRSAFALYECKAQPGVESKTGY
jgi:hypothetical protein